MRTEADALVRLTATEEYYLRTALDLLIDEKGRADRQHPPPQRAPQERFRRAHHPHPRRLTPTPSTTPIEGKPR